MTNTKGGQLADLELRHRRRARCKDRIRGACDTGLRNLPLHDTAQNRIWLETASLALGLLAWMPMLALTGTTAAGNPRSSACACSPPPHLILERSVRPPSRSLFSSDSEAQTISWGKDVGKWVDITAAFDSTSWRGIALDPNNSDRIC